MNRLIAYLLENLILDFQGDLTLDTVAWDEVSNRNIDAYLRYADLHNIRRATVYPRATQHIDEIHAMIRTLIERGMALSGNPFGASLFSTTFFCLTGFHGCHVFGGVVYLSCILVQALRGRYSETNHNPVEIAALYWHFVDLVWILVFTFVYLV